MSAPYTPGPWSDRSVQPHDVDEFGTVEVDFDAKPRCWAIWRTFRDEQGRRCHRPVADVHVVGQEWDEAEANARLIAAAPELLEALEAAMAVHGVEYSWGKQAEAAIAKARGHG